jgi:hypothetical protein
MDSITWITRFFEWLISLWPYFTSFIRDFIAVIVTISFPISLFFFIGIIYCVEQIKRVRKREEDLYDLKVEPAFETVESGDTAMAHRWENATKHIESPNPNDWKQAIIEADIILDDLLTKMGYRGESIGEKLKRVARGDMKTLDDAWEAHKVRNQIAHEGSNFNLNHNDAKRVLHMYRKVFEEFYYI